MLDIHQEISEGDIGKTVTISSDIFKIGSGCFFKLLFYSGNTLLNSYSSEITSSEFQRYSISQTIPADTTVIYLRVHSTRGTPADIYVDNFSMVIQ